MLSEFFRHLRYFLPRLAGYGLILGVLFGALTYPVLGAVVGAPWGLAVGLLIAFLLSIGIPIYNARFAPDDAAYQSRLSLGAGFITTLVMALPLLIIFAPVAGLTVAYLVHQYAESPMATGEKRKFSGDSSQRREKVFTKVAGEMLNYGKWVALLGIVVAMAIFLALGLFDISFSVFGAGGLIGIGLGGIFYSLLVGSAIAAVNGLFVHMMNRLYFDPDMPKERYKPQIIVMVSLLTLFTSSIVTFGLGAPFAAIAAALAANKYANWYYAEEGEEKAKRGARLVDKVEEDGELWDEVEEDSQVYNENLP